MHRKELTATTLTDQQAKQILKGVQALGRNLATAAEAFDFADGGVIRVRTMVNEVSDHDAFTHYAYNDGENPMGFIFTMDSLELVAVIGDDSVSDCTVVR